MYLSRAFVGYIYTPKAGRVQNTKDSSAQNGLRRELSRGAMSAPNQEKPTYCCTQYIRREGQDVNTGGHWGPGSTRK